MMKKLICSHATNLELAYQDIFLEFIQRFRVKDMGVVISIGFGIKMLGYDSFVRESVDTSVNKASTNAECNSISNTS